MYNAHTKMIIHGSKAMDRRLERILPRVQKPARYTGGEYQQIMKDKADVDLRVAFCFPDLYEIGMSNIGMRILYNTMNKLDGVWVERVFAPNKFKLYNSKK